MTSWFEKGREMPSFSPEEDELLACARDWKIGRLRDVHPSVGVVFNSLLVRSREDAVPLRRHSDAEAPSLTDLIRREYECAPDGENAPESHLSFEPGRRSSTPVHTGSHVSVG